MNARLSPRAADWNRPQRLLAMTAIAILVSTTTARGQRYDNPPVPTHIEWFDHASTAGESYLTGWSRLYRAWGEWNYYNSLAAANYQRAWTLELENRQRRAAPYIAQRENDRKDRLARTDRRRNEMLVRESEAALAADHVSADIDAKRGQLNWPAALRQPRYQRDLYQISTCLGHWVDNDHILTGAQRSVLKRSLGELRKQLGREQLKQPRLDLAEARGLLDNVDRVVFARSVPPARLAGGPLTDR